jgi:hypothetical protein
MYKQFVGLLSVTAILAAGCAMQPGDEAEVTGDAEQALTNAVVFKGGGNTGFSASTARTATITADKLDHATGKGGIGINLRVDDSRNPAAGSVTSAACVQRTITVTYSQADIPQFSVSSPKGFVRFGRCLATVTLEWNKNNPPGTRRILAPTASGQRVILSGMPVQPALGNISVVTKTNGVTNADPFDFRVDP